MERSGTRYRIAADRRRRRTVLFASLLSLILAVATLLVAVTGCGADGPGAGDGAVLTIEQALVAEPGEPIKVTGSIVATGSGADAEIVLASVLLESYPPQAGGATLQVSGLDLASLVGLSSTAGQPDMASVTWSDYPVVLEGVITDGVLEVQGTPRVAEATSGDVRVRFSPVSEPLLADAGTVWWAFDLQNVGGAPVDLTFSSGQRADVVLSQDGVEKYRWSQGKAFTEAIETFTGEPGQVFPIVLNDEFAVEPGQYDLVATVTATVGPEGAAQPLPELTMQVTVY
jgi:Intracellular proteinase inhibitor